MVYISFWICIRETECIKLDIKYMNLNSELKDIQQMGWYYFIDLVKWLHDR